MELRILCKWITITGTLLIWTVKWAIRPWFHFNPVFTFILGIAPNLIGSALLPFGASWLLQKYIDLRDMFSLRWFCVVCFALLVVNEYLQLIPVFGRTFDYYDILASAAGLYFSCRIKIKYLFANKYWEELG
ncbi:MAG: hypothetical protein HYR66_07170 [Sphingobacteriales bacterium]|nr:hypothetical protein [Sphingobacteriales bacterium]MBI3718157.1 hypothetical protein [Sphingobacteriales bacterium]